MGYSADKSPLIGHLAGPLRRLKPLGAQRQEKCGPNHLTREGLHATTPSLVNAVPIPMGVETCGTITPAPTMLTFAGTTARFLQTASSDSCGSFEVVGTLTRQ